MKILILFFLIFSLNGFTGYMSKSKMLNPDCDVERPFHTNKKICDLQNADCVEVPLNIRVCNLSELDTSVDDLDSPKYSKKEIEVCSDQAACEILNASKSCIDTEETVLMAADFSEIYCSKQIGFNQKIVKIIREDATKKALFDALLADKILKKSERDTKRATAKLFITKLKAGTDLTSAELRQALLALLKDLKS